MIYKVGEGRYTISSRGTWLPGSFDSERSARYAFKMYDNILSILREEINEKQQRAITFADLRLVKRLEANR